VKELADVYKVPGMLTAHEVDCLFLLGQIDHCDGVIVEIGSWKGKSTIALARGAAATHREKIYAIDPHAVQPEEGYLEDTRAEFHANLKQAGVDSQVVPMIMTSEKAAHGWSIPIRLLWIDGDHRYEPAQLDFSSGSPLSPRAALSRCTIPFEKKLPREFCGKMSSSQIVFKTSLSLITSPR
jgi:hypothetical protein